MDRGEAEAAFRRFVRFFSRLFQTPGFLDDARCRASYKDYVPRYYRKTFGQGDGKLRARHRKWLKRLAPLFRLPAGSSLLDYGGGYGLDSIFLASLGYRVTLAELTHHHLGVAAHLQRAWEEAHRPLALTGILNSRTGLPGAPGPFDAALLHEVAHHVEPPLSAFRSIARALKPGGRLFLLEPNAVSPLPQLYFLKVRGWKTVLRLTDEETGEPYLYGNENIRRPGTWHRIAGEAGLVLEEIRWVVPWMGEGPGRLLTGIPGLRNVLASHVTAVYQRPA